MKFARYLKDTQTPEWKKAYIDYRGLKKLITAIKNGQQNGNLEPLEELSESPRPSTSAEGRRSTTSNRAVPVETTVNPGYGSTGHTPPLTGRISDGTIVPPVDLPEPALPYPAEQDSGSPPSVASVDVTSLADAKRLSSPQKPQGPRAKTVSEFRSRSSVASSSSGGHGIPASDSPPGGFLANLRRRHSMRTHQRTESYSTRILLPLSAILPTLNPLERQFIDKLDKELEKVENFYMAREREAVIRWVLSFL
ncbi:SPX domain-containing protein [Phellopilus nigrolimitatus]|nr:SPX domain-containing protein [Phellopilus nigrolimitatus]